ncbi:FXYD domain-containing ion transport regulator 5 [Eptesicus fuscus]|uniref:FXYD domain-containing ion transport regulator 5 n=1 Tax=Eptesicus fuscus TaxID=29078 RepID=UPI00240479C6|nr:FXYD domain-containing ion transport regulator 5 [Eptesicus fuscus]XP_054567260.1 FXYD domain-containing ion transport regulator 5 [Eptesicus fuscus]XP_054567261.1 FXYD domain-containing ion transport regulator 5 [Eptesicus fuscus]XP_054567262.1 FXYD domain-containing ion transport regulator 5 [Eptesicus fuscus]
MSPSGRLYLLTIVGLILPTRGQTLEEATSISLADSTTVNIHALTQAPDAVHPELQSTPQTSTLQAGVETPTQTQTTQTQQLKGETVLLTTDPGTDERSTEADPTEGTTRSKQSPDKDFTTDPARRPTDSSEDDPFSYDEYTLRKQGLLVAAVLFITGIVILTSGKCRQLPRLCRNHNRAYRVTKAQPEREDPDGARADGQNLLPSQPCLL